MAKLKRRPVSILSFDTHAQLKKNLIHYRNQQIKLRNMTNEAYYKKYELTSTRLSAIKNIDIQLKEIRKEIGYRKSRGR